MTLPEKQRLFSKLIAQLILKAYDMGYEIACGEFYRTPEQAALNASKGVGITNSQHTKCLAADLNLFKDGKYLTKTEDHKKLGSLWETLHPLCRWGGKYNDGNHYEIL